MADETYQLDGGDGEGFTYEEASDPLAQAASTAHVGAVLDNAKAPKPKRKLDREAAREARKVMDKDQLAKHQGLLLQLVRWGESEVFGQYLYSCSFRLTPGALKSQSCEELEELLIRVKTTALGMQSKHQLETTVLTACRMLEQVSVSNERIKKHVNLQGWSQLCSRSEEVKQAIEIVRLTHGGSLLSLPPIVQLLLVLAHTAASTHTVNKYVASRRQTPAAEEPAEEEPAEPAVDEPAVDEADAAEAEQ